MAVNNQPQPPQQNANQGNNPYQGGNQGGGQQQGNQQNRRRWGRRNRNNQQGQNNAPKHGCLWWLFRGCLVWPILLCMVITASATMISVLTDPVASSSIRRNFENGLDDAIGKPIRMVLIASYVHSGTIEIDENTPPEVASCFGIANGEVNVFDENMQVQQTVENGARLPLYLLQNGWYQTYNGLWIQADSVSASPNCNLR